MLSCKHWLGFGSSELTSKASQLRWTGISSLTFVLGQIPGSHQEPSTRPSHPCFQTSRESANYDIYTEAELVQCLVYFMKELLTQNLCTKCILCSGF